MRVFAMTAAQFMAVADLFGDVPLDADQPATQATFQGQLVRNAEVRTLPINDATHGPSALPVVCMELRHTDKADHRSCTAQIVFKANERSQAEQCARLHKKGTVVTVAASALDVRMTFPHAHIINSYTPNTH